MGFAEILTLIFITLKLLDKIDWSWWWVLAPSIISIILIFVLAFISVFVEKGTYNPRKRR